MPWKPSTSPRRTSTQDEVREQFRLRAGSAKPRWQWSALSVSVQHDGSSCDRTTSIPPQEGTDGRNIAPSATGHAYTAGVAPSRCSTQMPAERVLRWHWAKRAEAKNGWSTRSFASTGAGQRPQALKTTCSWSQLASRGR